MRYAEFLRDMGAAEDKINQVINLIHNEIIGYVPEVIKTTLHADDEVIEEYSEIHPLVQQYVHDQIKLVLGAEKYVGE